MSTEIVWRASAFCTSVESRRRSPARSANLRGSTTGEAR